MSLIADGPLAGDKARQPLQGTAVDGIDLTSREMRDRVVFLRSLTDDTVTKDPTALGPVRPWEVTCSRQANSHCGTGRSCLRAQEAGANAVVIFNEGQPGRQEVLSGTLGGPATIPAVGVSLAEGQSLATAIESGTVTLHVTTSTLSETRTTYNTIADAPDGARTDHTVVVGSHLDSVAAGPGINDDGSGSSQDLEIALQYQKAVKNPKNHLRFVFFGAECVS